MLKKDLESLSLPIPLNLQVFADSKDKDNEDNEGKENEGTDHGSESEAKSEKTFSQKDVSLMMTKEKNEGRQAVLNALGVEKVEDAKAALEFFKKFNETFSGDKTPEEIQKALESDKTKAEERALAAENKLACVMAGVNKDSVDDVLAIASPKVTEDKDLAKVIEEMKSQAKYSSFFSEHSNKDEGTGSDIGHGKEADNKVSRAKALAEANKNNASKKSSFFN